MYDVESLGDDKEDKVDLLPPIYSKDVPQPQEHIQFQTRNMQIEHFNV